MQERPHCLTPTWDTTELQRKLQPQQAVKLSAACVLSSSEMFSDTLTLNEGINTVFLINGAHFVDMFTLFCYLCLSTRFA